MFKKISVIMLLTALSIFTAEAVSAESRSNDRISARGTTTAPRLEAKKVESKSGEMVMSGKVTSINSAVLNMDVVYISKSTTTKAVSTSTVSYTVSTGSSTKVFKNNSTSTLANIVVGDTIVVNGRLESKGSTKLVAKVIHNLGDVKPLKRFEEAKKSKINKIKARKAGEDNRGGRDDDNDDDKNDDDKGDGEKESFFKKVGKMFGF